MKNPVHYGLCRQTVTVYHLADGQVERRVIPNAFLEYRRRRKVGQSGEGDGVSFLLVIPGETQAVFPGDRIVHGVGPEVSKEEWRSFRRGNVPGLCVAEWAEQKFWDGKAVHTEAGA